VPKSINISKHFSLLGGFGLALAPNLLGQNTSLTRSHPVPVCPPSCAQPPAATRRMLSCHQPPALPQTRRHGGRLSINRPCPCLAPYRSYRSSLKRWSLGDFGPSCPTSLAEVPPSLGFRAAANAVTRVAVFGRRRHLRSRFRFWALSPSSPTFGSRHSHHLHSAAAIIRPDGHMRPNGFWCGCKISPADPVSGEFGHVPWVSSRVGFYSTRYEPIPRHNHK
jgi:hypothetical protein